MPDVAVGRPPAVVAVAQIAPVLGDISGNVDRAVAAVASAAARGAELVVLPELVTTGYAFADPAEARRFAEPSDGRSIRAFEAAAARHGVVIVGGFAEVDETGALRNSAFVVDPTGLRAVYRKAHLWDNETNLFEPGDQLPPVVDTALGRVGVVVCYDLEFPEWTRAAALLGADLLCIPTNWPATPRPAGERPPQLVLAQAAAMASRLFVAVCDRVGPERGIAWTGGSGIIAPTGYPLAVAEPDSQEDQLLLAECDLATARVKTTSLHNDVVADRRPDLYESLARRAATAHMTSGYGETLSEGDKGH